ncbi:hypothetical protein TELCIR_23042 [Teladorsagia circumcincta]|uniref:Uncharacterized protein n=1 Tax=Teladorsagia circumcincta TaxID=45464 RepID=A0A2G9TDY1_TELCI|nr:hypothetical protein TELCIR_23042 [Teladorsagia circumcincta]
MPESPPPPHDFRDHKQHMEWLIEREKYAANTVPMIPRDFSSEFYIFFLHIGGGAATCRPSASPKPIEYKSRGNFCDQNKFLLHRPPLLSR